MRKVWLALAILSGGCASHKPNAAALAAAEARAIQAQIDEADARILDGCYDCLLEARDTYLKLAATKTRPTVLPRLFEVQLLVALREKELALNPSEAIAQARDLVKDLPPAVEAEHYLGLVEAVTPDDVGTPRGELSALRTSAARGKYMSVFDEELKWLASSTGLSQPVRQYVTLAFDCSNLPRPRRPAQLPGESINRDPGPAAPPLVRYRYGICGEVRRAVLEKVREAVPQFVETSYFLARLDVAASKHAKAREGLGEVYKRFPTSPSVTYLNGNFSQLMGDCKAGLKFYDETIAIKPRHENGLLGRAMCLTYLKRQEEAIQAATHIIGLKLDNVADGYYWRAWNHHHLTQLELARADIESAKRLKSSGEVFTLAGIIEYDQNDLVESERDLNAAKSMYGGARNCTARWYLGLIEMKREHWLESGGHFEELDDLLSGRGPGGSGEQARDRGQSGSRS